jgi:hypothetical protein
LAFSTHTVSSCQSDTTSPVEQGIVNLTVSSSFNSGKSENVDTLHGRVLVIPFSTLRGVINLAKAGLQNVGGRYFLSNGKKIRQLVLVCGSTPKIACFYDRTK